MNMLKELTSKFAEEKVKKDGINIMQSPKIEKVVITCGITQFVKSGKKIDSIKDEIKKITGQIPVVLKAKVSCDSFHIRKGDVNALKVTLRKDNMYSFLEKTIFFVLPRMSYFKGFNSKSISRGTFNFGISDYTSYYEINKKTSLLVFFGFHIHIKTTAKNSKDTLELLKYLKIPFIT